MQSSLSYAQTLPCGCLRSALCREIEAELMERIRAAVLLPVRIDVKDVYDETCTELRVTAALDSGGRGRPRVTYDVTAALANMGMPQPS